MWSNKDDKKAVYWWWGNTCQERTGENKKIRRKRRDIECSGFGAVSDGRAVKVLEFQANQILGIPTMKFLRQIHVKAAHVFWVITFVKFDESFPR
ncbi:hypothetical protein V6N11_062078 [Hibiscus sabdariffa]|uniref:Uncharacterized protein n=1 Tax=Hibiscus sabdariffa TaxID=183260 RepID=A0ABR2PRT6_9ROSI